MMVFLLFQSEERNRDPKLSLKGKKDYVFVTYLNGGGNGGKKGGQISDRAFTKIFKDLGDELGYDNGEDFVKTRSHALRKFFTSTLESAGFPKPKIDFMVGHTLKEIMTTEPKQFERLLELIPPEVMPNVWFIPLGRGVKDPDVPAGARLKDEIYRLTAEQALERIKKGLNVGIYGIPFGLLFLDADTENGKIVLPLDIRRNIPATLTIKTINGGLQY